jgi:hypothetical protein
VSSAGQSNLDRARQARHRLIGHLPTRHTQTSQARLGYRPVTYIRVPHPPHGACDIYVGADRFLLVAGLTWLDGHNQMETCWARFYTQAAPLRSSPSGLSYATRLSSASGMGPG